ncbi:MAG: trypsin-like serine protease [Myxococcales bacterium]|nr:trypsin-like serine protease [Myxococcales bacterium]
MQQSRPVPQQNRRAGDRRACEVRRQSLGAPALVSLLGLCACVSSEPEETAVELSTQAVIIGGEPAGTCAWPSTVRVNGATGCTGTLIHPRVVTTAGHCLRSRQSEATIIFGERGQPGRFSLTGECTGGGSAYNTPRDWAYCILPDDPRLDQVPITPPLVGCEADRFLKPGARGWIVGFGRTSPRGGGRKHEVEVEINELDKIAPGTIDVGDAQAGACHGDSGGPIYMELVDGDVSYGYRVFGSTSGPGARFCDCTCSTTFVNIATHVQEIEENEGIDVTPCTAPDGTWDPGPECAAMLQDPRNGAGNWPGCDVTPTTAPIATCGEPFTPDPVDAPVDAGADPLGDVQPTADAGVTADGPTAGAPAPGEDTGQDGPAGSAGTDDAIEPVDPNGAVPGMEENAFGAPPVDMPMPAIDRVGAQGAPATAAPSPSVPAPTPAASAPAATGNAGAANRTPPASKGCGCSVLGAGARPSSTAFLGALLAVVAVVRARRRGAV